MALNSNKLPASKGMNITPMPPGTYPARSVMVADLGLQPQGAWQGKERPPAYKVALTYEFVDEFLKDENDKDMLDKPRWLTEIMPIYPLSAERAKSTARYNTLDPEGKYKGDFSKLADIPVMITVVHNPNRKKPGTVWENIGEVAPMRQKDAEKCPKLVNKVLVFDMDTPDFDVFVALPRFVQRLIVGGLEFEGSKLEEVLAEKNYSVESEEKVEGDGPTENPF